MSIQISHNSKKIHGEITLTSSKSISNRAIIIKALSGLDFKINNLSDAEDTKILLKLLSDKSLTTFDVGHAGTVMRFLTAYLAIQQGGFVLTGSKRMQQRPIKILVDALRNLGADITYLKNEGYPPSQIKGKKLVGGQIKIDGSVSSQYISALMLVAPYMEKGLKINFEGQVTSKPYLEMTIEMMRYFGANVSWKENTIKIQQGKYQAKNFYVEPDWSAASYWYGMVALAKHAEITLLGLKQESLQGDSVVAKMYENFGVQTEFLADGIRLSKISNFQFPIFPPERPLANGRAGKPQTSHLNVPFRYGQANLKSLFIKNEPKITLPTLPQGRSVTRNLKPPTSNLQPPIFPPERPLANGRAGNFQLDFVNCPDLAQTVAVTCAALNIPAKLTGLHTLRIKETDRVAALQNELTKLGFNVEVENDDLIILPSIRVDHSHEGRNLLVKTYNDHRMAMAFAPLALLYPIAIEDEDVVVKSYPNFWEDLKLVGFEIKHRATAHFLIYGFYFFCLY